MTASMSRPYFERKVCPSVNAMRATQYLYVDRFCKLHCGQEALQTLTHWDNTHVERMVGCCTKGHRKGCSGFLTKLYLCCICTKESDFDDEEEYLVDETKPEAKKSHHSTILKMVYYQQNQVKGLISDSDEEGSELAFSIE